MAGFARRAGDRRRSRSVSYMLKISMSSAFIEWLGLQIARGRGLKLYRSTISFFARVSMYVREKMRYPLSDASRTRMRKRFNNRTCDPCGYNIARECVDD